MLQQFALDMIGDATTTLATVAGAMITTVLPVMWSILAVTAVVGFGWLLIRRFTGR